MVLAQVVERNEVAAREVEDVDVVADGGAVFGGVVCGEFCEHAFAIRACVAAAAGAGGKGHGGPTVAENEELVSFTDCDLREQWQQVVRHALGVFAHDAAGVRTGGVEVTEKGGVPVVAGFVFLFGEDALGVDVVGDEVFDGGFGATIWVCGADGAVFGDGDHVWEAGGVAVDGSRRGEDDVGDIVLGHGGKEIDGTVDVGAVVFEGDFAGFSYCLRNVC